MHKFIFCFILALSTSFVFSQELFCDVSISAPDASKITSDAKVFKTLENAISEFMNTTKWTTNTYAESEKIDCSVFIAIKEQSGEIYSGSFTIISKRPVFNSDYNTTVMNIIDNDIVFTYKEFQAIEIADNQFVSNLSHLLAFYANMMIGIDHETFENKGGEIHLQKALDLVNTVSSTDGSRYKGWKSIDNNKRSRYWLITNLMNPRYELFRTAQYKYYREGLDNFYNDDILARKNIKLALADLAKISLDDPNLSLMQMWSDSKSKETIDIYKDAPEAEKKEIVNILRKVDPVNADKYKVISK
jgi:hypothetical protein